MTREKIERFSCPEPTTGCWLWTRRRTDSGYGLLSESTGARPRQRNVYAHRAAYKAYVGPIPDGLRVCHRCDTPACVNPDHLFVGTGRDNSIDMIRKGRASAAKLTACDVLAIRAQLRLGARGTASALARAYGVSPAAISSIRHGRKWRWL